jgi:flagellar hook protein FlgE
MFTVLETALSALSGISSAVDVVGNNLANLNTTGFKASTVHFSEIMGQQLGSAASGSAIGQGVSAPLVVTSYTQGNDQRTNGALDAAISGSGFFVVHDSGNRQLYTRDGSFSLDSTGHLVTAAGSRVQGWNAAAGVLTTSGPADDIVVPMDGISAARATKGLSLSVNLNSAAVVDAPGATYSVPVQVVDSLGGSHTVTATFTKKGPNEWSYAVTLPEGDVTSEANASLATGTLKFDSKGQLTSPTGDSGPVALKLTGLANGAADQTVNWSLYSGAQSLITQFATDNSISATLQDGQPAGQIASVGLEQGGLVVAHYSNGQQQTIGQIALASISNPDTLVSAGNNNLATTSATSAPTIGVAGTGGRGDIEAGALESSTADIATEFTNLITLQRSYSANARVITSADEMLQDLMSVKR